MLFVVSNGEKKTLPSATCLEDYISNSSLKKKKKKKLFKTKYSAFYSRITVELHLHPGNPCKLPIENMSKIIGFYSYNRYSVSKLQNCTP